MAAHKVALLRCLFFFPLLLSFLLFSQCHKGITVRLRACGICRDFCPTICLILQGGSRIGRHPLLEREADLVESTIPLLAIHSHHPSHTSRNTRPLRIPHSTYHLHFDNVPSLLDTPTLKHVTLINELDASRDCLIC